jgi:hypothetical protein
MQPNGHQPIAMEEVLPLGTGAREPGCEQTRKDDQGPLQMPGHQATSDQLHNNGGKDAERGPHCVGTARCILFHLSFILHIL